MTEATEQDRALAFAYSILSLLHHRGLDDSARNRADVRKAVALLHPFVTEARTTITNTEETDR